MITILCPAYNATGGTEVIHQLAYKLNMLGYRAGVYYIGLEEGRDPKIPNFARYNVPWIKTINDAAGEYVICPEFFLEAILQIHRAQKIIWWLSVDNAKFPEGGTEQIFADRSVIHFCQSHYAMDFAAKNGALPEHIYYLADYVRSDFLIPGEKKEREDIVLYNPRKGFEKTKKLIEASEGSIRWVPLTNMTPLQVKEAYESSKVYVDFGNHPGMDRMPREAALGGCLVITGRKGSAAYREDVPIPDEYRFPDENCDRDIVSSIAGLLSNYEKKKYEFSTYTGWIRRQFLTFETDIYKAFGSICGPSPAMRAAEGTDLPGKRQLIADSLERGDSISAFAAITSLRNCRDEKDGTDDIYAYLDDLVLDINVRIALNESDEAEFLIWYGLEQVPDSLELTLWRANLCVRRKAEPGYCEKTAEACRRALELAEQRNMTEQVLEEVKFYINALKTD